MSVVLDQQNNAINGSYIEVYGVNYVSQTFVAGEDGILYSIMPHIKKQGNPANLIVEIQSIDGAEPSGIPLISEEFSSSLVTGDDFVEFVFTGELNITSGTSYAMVFYQKSDGGDAFNTYSIKGNAVPDYSFGSGWESNDSGLNWMVQFDRFFKTYVDVGTVEVIDDIINDFRMIGTYELADITNDFRLIGVSVSDIINDFRMIGTYSLYDINNKFTLREEITYDLDNKIQTLSEPLYDINNNFILSQGILKDIDNDIRIISDDQLFDCDNDIRIISEPLDNISNDFRILKTSQVVTPPAPLDTPKIQAVGKEGFTVLLNDADMTAVIDLDSLSWREVTNMSATASFNLVVPYDTPITLKGQTLEILFDGRRKFYGYVTRYINKSNPEGIEVIAEGEYNNINETEVDFKVGRELTNETDTYYNNVNEALEALGVSFNIGYFTPDIMDCTGGKADIITKLVQECGNYSWFIKPDGTKKLKIDGQGTIVNLQRQVIGSNIDLFQVIEHELTEDTSEVVNKYKVIMGDTIKPGYNNDFRFAWVLDQQTFYSPQYIKNHYEDGFSVFYHTNSVPKAQRHYVSNINWYDRRKEQSSGSYETKISLTDGVWKITVPPGYLPGYPLILSGTSSLLQGLYKKLELGVEWSFDYLAENAKVDYSYVQWVHYGGVYPELRKENTFEISYGDYPDTIAKDYVLSNLNKQVGTNYITWEGKTIDSSYELGSASGVPDYLRTVKQRTGYVYETKKYKIPSWDDTEYATDYATWQLSKNANSKWRGKVVITFDCADYYNIDLSKRIKVPGAIDTPINIVSIDYNVGNYTVTLNLESADYYNRSVSYPVHEREEI